MIGGTGRTGGGGDAACTAHEVGTRVSPYKHDLLAATERALDVPFGADPLTSAAEHFVESILAGTEPLTSGVRSLRVVETLETADRTAERSGKLA